ncbi:MAG: preprotein translocase subunit SecE [Cellulomonadaceae bacterium]|nr:preprotein translocase subunit SecE [Cellulomonadaceae bacterium]
MSDAAAFDAGSSNSASKKAKNDPQRKGLFARIALFWRQVISELKKVVSPTRSELLKMTGVVLVFVVIIMAFVGLVDYLVGMGAFALFGG